MLGSAFLLGQFLIFSCNSAAVSFVLSVNTNYEPPHIELGQSYNRMSVCAKPVKTGYIVNTVIFNSIHVYLYSAFHIRSNFKAALEKVQAASIPFTSE